MEVPSLALPTRTRWMLAAVAAVLIVAAVGYLWVRKASTAILAEAKQSFEAGRAVGQSLVANVCLDTFFVRHATSTESGMRHEIDEEVFLEGCLRTSTPTALCDTVPSTSDVSGIVRFSTWSVAQCRLRSFADAGCPRALKAIMHYCTKRRQPDR